jgi:hypothetical protein
MSYAIVTVPAAPVRKKPKHQREMTNQLLFGEAIQVLKEKGNLWIKIRSLHDHYEGWITRTFAMEVSEDEVKGSQASVATGLINRLSIGGVDMHVPLAATLPHFAKGKGHIGQLEYAFEGDSIIPQHLAPSPERIVELCMQWLNAPYCWGGRTIFGVDCSGFMQVNFKLMGINLPRDAWQQAQEGHVVKKMKDAGTGDLVFFDDREEIVHVGLLLNNQAIIHASGKVRIDDIDKKGIINRDTGKRTHSLRAIRKVIQ